MSQDTDDLVREVKGLREQVARLNNHRYIRLHDNLGKLGLFQLYRGLAFGLGSVLGATILVSLAAFLLAQIDFIPIIGDWAADLAREIDAENAQSYGIEDDVEQPDTPPEPEGQDNGNGIGDGSPAGEPE